MLQLTASLQAWNTPDFVIVFKREIETLGPGILPLQQALTVSSVVTDGRPTALIQNIGTDNEFIIIKLGICYAGIVAGCSCTDDPTPMSENAEYCEVLVKINKHNADTTITLLNH